MDDEGSPRSIDVMAGSFDTGVVRYKEVSENITSANVKVRTSEAGKLRLCTYNIHGWRDTDHADNFERIVTVLSKISADVIVLQEVLYPFRPPSDAAAAQAYFDIVKSGKGNGYTKPAEDSEGKPYLEELATRLGMPHISFGCATNDGYFGSFGYGNALLSRYPIASEEHHVLIPAEHHQANRRIEAEQRCVSLVSLKTTEETEARFVFTHLDQLSDDLRLDQVTSLVDLTRGLGPHILAGDFNVFQRSDCSDEAWGKIVGDAESKGWTPPPETTKAINKLLSGGYRDSFWESDNHKTGEVDCDVEGAAGDTKFPGATCWVVKPLLRIDYAFLSSELVSAGVKVMQHQRVLDDASDHFPVLVDFTGVATDVQVSEN